MYVLATLISNFKIQLDSTVRPRNNAALISAILK